MGRILVFFAACVAAIGSAAAAHAQALSPWVDPSRCRAYATLGYYDQNFSEWLAKGEAGDPYGLYYAGCLKFSASRAEGLQLLQRAATAGVPEAEEMLGTYYLGVDPGVQNLPLAREYLTRAAERGDARALFNVGQLYNEGLGVAKDPATATQWYRRAAFRGDPLAQTNLARTLLTGPTPEQDRPFALGLLFSADLLGDRVASQGAAMLRLQQWAQRPGMPPNAYDLSLQANNLLARNNVAGAAQMAQPLLGSNHPLALTVTGLNLINTDPGQARALLIRADGEGFPNYSMPARNVVRFYHAGLGVPKDSAQMYLWLQRAAISGDREAEFTLVQVHFQNPATIATSSSLQTAWFDRAREMKHLEIWKFYRSTRPDKLLVRPTLERQRLLEAVYQGIEKGINKNYYPIPQYLVPHLTADRENFRAAAEAGDMVARMWMAAHHGMRREEAEAVRWTRLAAEQGLPEAQRNLGDRYLVGRDAPADAIEAYVWHSLALQGGHFDGLYQRPALAGSQLAEANRRIVAFRPKLK